MNLIERLERYTRYANGDESCAGELAVEDEILNEIDFSKYDLNNSYFGGVVFNNCDFSNVCFERCKFESTSFKGCKIKDVSFINCESDRGFLEDK